VTPLGRASTHDKPPARRLFRWRRRLRPRTLVRAVPPCGGRRSPVGQV